MMGRKALDLAGKRFGRLVVIEKAGVGASRYVMWNCRCDCGNSKTIRGSHLAEGRSQSCGCLQREIMQEVAKTRKDRRKIAKLVSVEAGQKYGRLAVVNRDGKDKFGYIRWRCLCDCGKEVTVRGAFMTSGNTLSCGCLQIDKVRGSTLKNDTPTGLSTSPEYSVWNGMIDRCTNPKSSSWELYGGRGIGICLGWMSFANFYKDMSPRPNGLSIDRINNDDGYSCGHCEDCTAHGWAANCRWATAKEQANNRRPRRQKSIIS